MGFNSPEWAISYYGAMFHNNVVSGVYTTNGPSACKYQAEHSSAQVIVVDTEQQLKLYMGLLDQLPNIKAIVTWGCDSLPEEAAKDSRVFKFKDFLELGSKVDDAVIQQIINGQKPGNCVCLIYTSGTTGNPKGVMLSHDNLIFNSLSLAATLIQGHDDPNIEHRVVSYLPLSHIAGLQMDLTN